jgi:hypothetical protein
MNRKKKYWVIFGGFVVLAAVLFSINAAHIILLYQREALDCTWLASLSYMQAAGAPPDSMKDLFKENYLRQSDKHVSLWVAVDHESGKFTGTKDMEYIGVNFPSKMSDLKEDQGRLIDSKTGKEWFLVSTDFWLFPKSILRGLNLSYWQQWTRYENGENQILWLRIRKV